MQTLKVGDVLSVNRRYTTDFYIIERVTKTQAISGHTRFKIQDRGFGFAIIGDQYRYGHSSSHQEKEDHEKKVKHAADVANMLDRIQEAKSVSRLKCWRK